jgi:FkbM family methyltransferase
MKDPSQAPTSLIDQFATLISRSDYRSAIQLYGKFSPSLRFERGRWLQFLRCVSLVSCVDEKILRSYMIIFPDDPAVISLTHDIKLESELCRIVSYLATVTFQRNLPARENRASGLMAWEVAKVGKQPEAAHFLGRRYCWLRSGVDLRTHIDSDTQTVSIKTSDFGARYHVKSGTELSQIANFCAAEPALVEWLLQMNSDDILLDVGANIRQYTIFAAVASGVRVLALEPFGPNFDRLVQNIHLNRQIGRVTALKRAVGRSSGMAALSFTHRTPGVSAQNIVHPSQALPRDKSFEQIELISIDDLLDNAGMPIPTCVKIDVDGHEEDVVAGMRQLLDKSPPRALMIETRKWNAKNRSFVDELRERGYALGTGDSPKNLYFSRNI